MTCGFLERPGCRLYYEVEGTGPFLVFAHGLGGNHLSWWQQVPHFRARYSLRDLLASRFCAVERAAGRPRSRRLCGRPCGAARSSRREGRTHRGAVDGRLERARIRLAKPETGARAGARLDRRDDRAWPIAIRANPNGSPAGARERSRGARSVQPRPASGGGRERMAREQPAAHYLYRRSMRSGGIDKVKLRAEASRHAAAPGRYAAHAQGADALAYRRRGHRLSAVRRRGARAADAECAPRSVQQAGHSVYFERPAEFNRIVDAFLAANP